MSTAGFAESVDRRVLGGVVFVDAITGETVDATLAVTSADLRVRPTASGVYAIFDAPGLSALTNEFIPVEWSPPQIFSPPQTFEVTVRDPSRRYLARRAAVKAPQDPSDFSLHAVTLSASPPARHAPNWAQRITLYGSPSAALAPNWAVIRASVKTSAGNGLPWAAVRVIKSDNSVAAAGMTDARGEAVLAVAGLRVQVSSDASGSVPETTIPVTVQAWFDPNVLKQPAGWVPNPDDIFGNLTNPSLKSGKQSGALGAGKTLYAAIAIAV